MLTLALLLLSCADILPPIDNATVRAVWLADLTPERVTSGPRGRFVFVPDSLVDEHDGCYGVEAAGPPGVSRTIQFARGESDEASTSCSRLSSRGSCASSATGRGASSGGSSS